MSILDAARAAKAQQEREELELVVINSFSAREEVDRSQWGDSIRCGRSCRFSKQELTRPEDSAKAAQQILQGAEDDDADEHEAWESRLSATRKSRRFYILRERSSPTLTILVPTTCSEVAGSTSMAHWLSVVCNTIRHFAMSNRGIRPQSPGISRATVIFSTVASNERAIETADAIIVLEARRRPSVYEADDIGSQGRRERRLCKESSAAGRMSCDEYEKGGGGGPWSRMR